MKKLLLIAFLIILPSCEEKQTESSQEIGELVSLSIPTASYNSFQLADDKDPRSYLTHTIVQIRSQDAICNGFSFYGSKTFSNGSPMNLRLPENCSFTVKIWYANEVRAVSAEQSFEANLFYESEVIQIPSSQLKSKNFDASHQIARTSFGSQSGFELSSINLKSTGFWSAGGDDSDAWDSPADNIFNGDGDDDSNDNSNDNSNENLNNNSGSSGTDERLERGRSLYIAHCGNASCHPSSASNSAKRFRSAQQISGAIQTYTQMSRVSASSSEIEDIAYALGK